MVAERGRPIYRTHGSYRVKEMLAVGPEQQNRVERLLLIAGQGRVVGCFRP
jgi:hypothetical protein